MTHSFALPTLKWVEKQLAFSQTIEQRRGRLLDVLEPLFEQFLYENHKDQSAILGFIDAMLSNGHTTDFYDVLAQIVTDMSNRQLVLATTKLILARNHIGDRFHFKEHFRFLNDQSLSPLNRFSAERLFLIYTDCLDSICEKNQEQQKRTTLLEITMMDATLALSCHADNSLLQKGIPTLLRLLIEWHRPQNNEIVLIYESILSMLLKGRIDEHEWRLIAIGLTSMSRTQSTKKFISNMNSILSEFMETDQASISLLQLALLLNQRCMKDSEIYFKEEAKWNACLAIVFSALKSQHSEMCAVALSVFKKIIPHDASGTVFNMIEVMMGLIEICDCVSDIVVGMLAEISLQHPERLLGILVNHLDTDKRDLKLNIILVIERMIEVNRHRLESRLATTLICFQKILADKLLNLLLDQDLELRNLVSRIFLILESDVIVQELCKRTFEKDMRVRSAATTSLILVLQDHSNFRECLLNFFDFLRNLSSSTSEIVTPSDIFRATFEESSTEAVKDIDLLIAVISKWCSKATENRLREFFLILVQRCFDSPKDLSLITLCSRTGSFLKDKETVEDVFMSISNMLENRNIPEDMKQLEYDVFKQLSPLLILRTCSQKAYEVLKGSSIEDCLVKRLWSRLDAQKFESVRRLCAELLGRFSLELIIQEALHRFDHSYGMNDFVFSKYCLLVLIYMNLVHQSHCIAHFKDISQCLFRVISQDPENFEDIDEFNKLQYGCMDLLAIMIVVELKNSSNCRKKTPLSHLGAVNEPILIGNPFSILNQVIYDLKTKHPISFRICLLNSLTLSIRHLDKQTLPMEKDIIRDEKKHIIMQLLEAEIAKPLVSLVFSEKESEYLLTALLQCLLNLVAVLKNRLNENNYHDIFKISLNFLETGKPELVLASLKLQSALLSCAELLSSLDFELLRALKNRLHFLMKCSTNNEVLELTEKLACFTFNI